MAIKRTFVYRDGRIIETTPKRRENVPLASKEESIRRESCYVLDDMRQDYQRSSNEDERAYYKAKNEAVERARWNRWRR